MSDTIDRLDIAIEAQASNAVAEVDKLYASLERIAVVLNTASGAFGNMKTAVQGVNTHLRKLAKISLPNLTTMTQQLQDLSQINLGNMGLGQNINVTADAFQVLETTSEGAGKSMNALKLIVDGVKTAFNGLVDVVKGVASHVGDVAKFMVSNFTMVGRLATGLGKVRGLLSGILGPLIGFYGVRSLVTLGKDAVELASDLTEVQNVVNHAFGIEGAKAVEDFVSTSKEQYGLAELAAKQYSSRFQAMGKSMGITADMVAKSHDNVRDHMVKAYQDTGDEMGAMALNLTKLTADMASFYNEDQAQVAQALQSVFTGQTRSLRQFGIDLTQVNLAEWAMKQGIDADIASMTQAEKAMLRYQYVMAQTSMVQGDFARTSDTWANQIRLLKQNFQALGSTIGNVVINAFKPLITWLNAAMTKVIAFAETIANALGKIFGWTIRGEAGGGGDAGMGDLSDGLGGVGDAADGAGKSLGGANEKAKELKRTLLGFDEINKLNEPTDSSSGSGGSGGGGSGGGGGAGGGGASAGDFQLVQTETIFDKFKSDFQTLFGLGKYISATLSEAMESIDWDSVYKSARNFGSGLAEFLNGLISPRLFRNLGITIAGAINTVLNAQDAFLNRFNFKNLGYSIAAGIKGFFETWDAGLSAKVFYKTVNGIIDTLWSALDGVGDTGWSFIGTKISSCIRSAISNIKWERAYSAADKFGSGLASYMNGLIKPSTFSALGDTIAKFLNTELRTLSAWASKFNWDSFGRSLAAGLRRFISSFDWNFAASTFNTLARGILRTAGEAISGVNWLSFGLKIRNAIMLIDFDKILLSVGNVIMKAINGALDFAKGLFDGTPIETLITGLQEKLNGIAEKIDLPAIANGIDGIVKALSPAMEGFAKGFTDALGVFADIGGGALLLIGAGLKAIAAALSDMDPAVVEAIGKALGVVAGSMLAITLYKGAVGIVGSLIGKFTGAAVATGAMAEAVSGTATGATATGGLAGAFALLKAKAAAAASALLGGGGYVVAITAGARLAASFVEVLQGGNGKLSEYAGITRDVAGELNKANKFTNEQSSAIEQLGEDYEDGKISAEEFGKKVETVFKDAGVSVDDLELAMATLNGNGFPATINQTELMQALMEDLGKATSDAESDMGSMGQTMQTFGQKGASLSGTGFGGLLSALLNVGENAEKAGTKSEAMKSGIWAFASGVAGQALLMAVMGGAFKNIGTNAESSKTLIAGFVGSISNAVADIKKQAGPAKESGEDVTKGTATGMTDSVSMAALDKANQDVANKITGGMRMLMATHSPSKVMATIGNDITLGLAQGISEKASDALTSMTTILNNMLQNVRDKYESFRTVGSTLATRFANGVRSVSMPDLGDKLKSAMGNYANAGNSNPFYDVGHNIANAFKNGVKSVTATLSYRQIQPNAVISVGGKQQSVPRYVAEWYASGGFPNYGEVYIANERGPEMIGRFGTKNVVANNAQITEGIKAAVVDGMMQVAMSGAFGGGNADGQPYVMEVTVKTQNDEVLARAVQRGQLRRNTRYNPGFAGL